jgi:hypothetical protein
MAARVVSFVRRQSTAVDWTRDELAELYRIEHALTQSGLTLEVERGVTDEGDPWFAFCRPDGEVLIHLARYDGLYRLHSPALLSPLIGRSFSELTKAFSRQVPLQLTLQRDTGPRVFVHPAAMLAVVIGTIFVASNELAFSPQTVDSGKKLDDASEAASAHNMKALLQSTVQLYIENFFSWLRDGAIFQQSAHLTVISTVVAFIVGSDTATDTDQARDAVTHAKSAAEGDGAWLAALGSASDATHRAATTDGSAEHSAASHQLDVALVGVDDSEEIQQLTAAMHYTRSEAISNYGAGPESNKTSDAATDMVQDVALSDPLTTNAASEFNTGAGLQSDTTIFLSTAIIGETPVTASSSGQSDKLDVVLSGTNQSIDLGDSTAVHELVLSGDGEFYVSGITASDPLSVYVTSGSHQELFLSYQAVVAGPPVAQTVTLGGADTVSLTEAPKAGSTAVALTIDSEGSQANILNVADPTSNVADPTSNVADPTSHVAADPTSNVADPTSKAASSANVTFEITIVGAQNLTLNESAATFHNSNLNDSGLAANLTVGIDFGATVSVSDFTLGASNFVVHESDSVALVNLADNSQIILDTSLNSVLLSMDANSGPGAVSLDMQPSSQDAIEINAINALGLASLSIDSNSVGPHQVNEVVGLIDANLSILTITGDGALTIGSIYGIAAGDGQNVTIDAHALSAPLTLNVSGIDDISAGGRVITIIGGSDGSVLTNMVASEDTVFTGGAGINTYNIGQGAVLDTITDLKATDAVNVGSASFTDSFVNGLTMNSAAQLMVNSQNDLIDAALAVSRLLGDSSFHQAVLFSYHGNEYVFVTSDAGNGFDGGRDAIVKVVGLSAGVDLAGVFHSA